MDIQQELVQLIIDTARELGEEESWGIGELTAGTVLYGKNGILDSMGLVSLVIAVEQAIEDRYDKAVALADEKAMSQSRSPYRSPLLLAEYAASQLQDG